MGLDEEQKDEVITIVKEFILGIQELMEQKAPVKKKYFTRNETCVILGVSLPTLNEYTKKGLIKSHQFGRRVLYKSEDIEQSLQERKSRI